MHLSVYLMARRRLLSVCENLRSPSVILRRYSDYLHHRLPIPSCLSASLQLSLGADRTALRSGDTGIDFNAYSAWFRPLSWVCAKLIQWVNESNSIRKSVRNRFIVCQLLSLLEGTIRRVHWSPLLVRSHREKRQYKGVVWQISLWIFRDFVK